jgi:hypothetical protein
MQKQKKILVTFDLNCLLGYVSPCKRFLKENSLYPDYPPHKVVDGFNIWSRPNLDILINTLFISKRNIFDVGIWASQTKENSALQINNFLGSLKFNLSFALFTKPPEEYEKDNLLPFPFKRDLRIIFDKHKEYDEFNTIIFTNYPNEQSEFRENEIVLPLYHPQLGSTQFNLDAHMYYTMEYLSLIHSMMTKQKS